MQVHSKASCSRESLIPPNPALLSNHKNTGQKLLSLLRSLEKLDDNDNITTDVEEFVSMMETLIASVGRRGLLYDDAKQVAHILSTTSPSATGAGGGGSNSAKRNRGAGRNGGGGLEKKNTGSAAVVEQNQSEPTAASDVQLIIATICRILDSSTKTSAVYDQYYWILFVKLAADTLRASASFVAEYSSSQAADSVEDAVLAEYELLASNGKQLLSLLCNDSGARILQLLEDNTAYMYDEEGYAVLSSCLIACSSLVCLFGTKLSRNTQLVKDIQQFALKCLAVTKPMVVKHAASLIACLPCVGGLDGRTPPSVWTEAVDEWTAILSESVQAIAPLQNTTAPDSDKTSPEQASSCSPKDVAKSWLTNIGLESSETIRIDLYCHALCSICSTLGSLIKNPAPALVASFTSSLNVSGILDLLEKMIAFPITAENVYYGTRKRLRSELIGDCLLSPSSVCGQVANIIKHQGLELIIKLIESIGGASLAPFAGRFRRIIGASLANAVSLPVRNAVDPTSIEFTSEGRKRWLHTSIALRTQAVLAFRVLLLSFGTELNGLTMQGSRHATTMTERSIYLVGGTVIEELMPKAPVSDFWGSSKERAELSSTGLACLESSLTKGGEYMPLNLRQFVDSVAKLALNSLSRRTPAASSVDNGLSVAISLAIACVQTPYPDGSMSWLIQHLLPIAKQEQNSPKMKVICSYAIQVCNTALAPRVPALASRVPVHSLPDARTTGEVTIESVKESIENAQASKFVVDASLSPLAETNETEAVANSAASGRKSSSAPKGSNHSGTKKRSIKDITDTTKKVAVPPKKAAVKLPAHNQPAPESLPKETIQAVENDDDEDADFELPMIIDTGPDAGDEGDD